DAAERRHNLINPESGALCHHTKRAGIHLQHRVEALFVGGQVVAVDSVYDDDELHSVSADSFHEDLRIGDGWKPHHASLAVMKGDGNVASHDDRRCLSVAADPGGRLHIGCESIPLQVRMQVLPAKFN